MSPIIASFTSGRSFGRGGGGAPGIQAIGGTVSTSGGYVYHTFTGSNTFQVLAAPAGATLEYLIVAGGGAGGSGAVGPGGGAGGYRTGVLVPSVQSYTITIGNGGTAVAGAGTRSNNGQNSSAFGITSTGGGGGNSDDNGVTGGSGSGGGGRTGNFSGGSGTAGQGNAGGQGFNTGNREGGGGGGAGQAGQNGGVDGDGVGGTGGNGLQWLDGNYYAGGGGGANENQSGSNRAGGLGGGGRYIASNGAVAEGGSPNTGGGGGAGGYNNEQRTSGNGGSGIVIIRYPESAGGSSGTFSYVYANGNANYTAGNGFNNTTGLDIQTQGCSGALSFDGALNYCHSTGGRLPTIDEYKGGAVAGTGCGYDANTCWSCDAPEGDTVGSQHYGIIGTGAGTEVLLNTSSDTAYARCLVDNDANRADPVILTNFYILNWLSTNGYL